MKNDRMKSQNSQSAEQDTSIALDVMRAIALDTAAPANARVQAARTMLELLGKLGKHAPPPASEQDRRELSTMTRAELEAELARLRADPFGT